ncbi:MIP18 family protein [Oopsacas minuta]|uniref:MIP18 family protein n=1 Tax=Oopsacas minuta TaxID=111878 RepID=A0AAV7KHX2_9METZ|nr:MIP18 family protein [Oopsacas minuta]
MSLENINPTVCPKLPPREGKVDDPFDSRGIFDLIRCINDPEHPLTLEELSVVSESQVLVSNEMSNSSVHVYFTPTIPGCSMATLIGLSIKVQLLRNLPSRFKCCIEITPGTHNSEQAINKQLADKERIAAALENPHLMLVIDQCLDVEIV